MREEGGWVEVVGGWVEVAAAVAAVGILPQQSEVNVTRLKIYDARGGLQGAG